MHEAPCGSNAFLRIHTPPGGEIYPKSSRLANDRIYKLAWPDQNILIFKRNQSSPGKMTRVDESQITVRQRCHEESGENISHNHTPFDDQETTGDGSSETNCENQSQVIDHFIDNSHLEHQYESNQTDNKSLEANLESVQCPVGLLEHHIEPTEDALKEISHKAAEDIALENNSQNENECMKRDHIPGDLVSDDATTDDSLQFMENFKVALQSAEARQHKVSTSFKGQTFQPIRRATLQVSNRIQVLQDQLQQAVAKGTKPKDIEIIKKELSEAEKMSASFSSMRRLRSQSRSGKSGPKYHRTVTPGKRERPYRNHWLGVTKCVPPDSKYIISSKEDRKSKAFEYCGASKEKSIVPRAGLKGKQFKKSIGQNSESCSSSSSHNDTLLSDSKVNMKASPKMPVPKARSKLLMENKTTGIATSRKGEIIEDSPNPFVADSTSKSDEKSSSKSLFESVTDSAVVSDLTSSLRSLDIDDDVVNTFFADSDKLASNVTTSSDRQIATGKPPMHKNKTLGRDISPMLRESLMPDPLNFDHYYRENQISTNDSKTSISSKHRRQSPSPVRTKVSMTSDEIRGPQEDSPPNIITEGRKLPPYHVKKPATTTPSDTPASLRPRPPSQSRQDSHSIRLRRHREQCLARQRARSGARCIAVQRPTPQRPAVQTLWPVAHACRSVKKENDVDNQSGNNDKADGAAFGRLRARRAGDYESTKAAYTGCGSDVTGSGATTVKVLRPDATGKVMQKIRNNQRKGKVYKGSVYINVMATHDYEGTLPGQLSFSAGQVIKLRCPASEPSDGFCYGYYKTGRLRIKKKGLFPVSHVDTDYTAL